MKKIGIIGGGISGLSCAYQLSKLGIDFKLFERNEITGGRIKSFEIGEESLPLGAFAFSMNYRNVVELISEMGLTNKITKGVFGKLGIYTRGRLIKVSLISILFDRTISLRTKIDLVRLRRFMFRITPQVLDNPAYDVSLEKFILERYSEGVLKDFVEPSIISYFAEPSSAVSAKYGLRVLSASFNTCELQGTLYPLVETITAKLGNRIAMKTQVMQVTPRESRVEVITDRGKEEFDLVVCCLPIPELKQISGLQLPDIRYEVRNAYVIKGVRKYPGVASIVNGDPAYHVDHVFYRGKYAPLSAVMDDPVLDQFLEKGEEIIHPHRWNYCAPRT